MASRRFLLATVSLAAIAVAGVRPVAAQPETAATERDYFAELPIVLSVSRLAQPLDETPGAVTVIDRETIRRSGARELYDVLKLVPGFLTSRVNGANPLANYHGDFDALNRRLQVFVDGRSVYSGLFAGNAGNGSLGVVLEDVERIEVLRGSNSAAYGTNAYMGVVNVVTAHTSDTRGAMASVTEGGGVADRVLRFGWGDGTGSYRATFSQRKDEGLYNLSDDRLVKQAHFRGDFQLSPRDELLLETGGMERRGGEGTSGDAGDPARTAVWTASYGHGQWKRQLNTTDELRVSGSFDEERFRDTYPYYPLSTNGLGRRLDLQAQYAFAVNPQLRMVAGGRYRYEFVDSPSMFYGKDAQSNHFWDWFSNVEWRPHPQWVVNAGGLFEHHSITGSRTSPRVMVNFHALPDHTLRAGTTTAYRVPTLFELRGDWRTNYLIYRPFRFLQATGGAEAERLNVAEVGYLGEFRPLRLSVDFRGFNERAISRLRYYGLNTTVSPTIPGPTNTAANDWINKSPTRQRGWESQLRWRPLDGTQIILNHTVLRILDVAKDDQTDRFAAPSHYSMLMLMQRLPADFDLSVTYSTAGQVAWVRMRDMLPPMHQLDLRLAKKFRVGATPGEVAVVAQAVDASHPEYYPNQIFKRRAFATLRLDF